MSDLYIVIARTSGRIRRWRVLAPNAAAAALMISSSHPEPVEIVSVHPDPFD